MKTKAVALSLALAALSAPTLAAEPITGRWVTAEKDAVVHINKCGKALCGTIERFLILPKGGKDQRDVNNSDPAKRTRKLIGTPVLTGLTAADALWKGQVYDPKSGKTYTSEVRRKDAATLEVKGCVGFLCQTQVWKKAS